MQLIWNTSGERWWPGAYLNPAMSVQSPCSVSVTLLHPGCPVEQIRGAGAIFEKGMSAITARQLSEMYRLSACDWHAPLSVSRTFVPEVPFPLCPVLSSVGRRWVLVERASTLFHCFHHPTLWLNSQLSALI